MAAAMVNAAIEEMNRRIETLRSGQAGGKVISSPQRMLDEARLTLPLKTQNELARIDQFRRLPDAVVLDPAIPPVRRDSPHRLVMVIATLLKTA